MIGKKHRYYIKTHLRFAVAKHLNKDKTNIEDINDHIKKYYAVDGISAIGVIPYYQVTLEMNPLPKKIHELMINWKIRRMAVNPKNTENLQCTISEFCFNHRNKRNGRCLDHDEEITYRLGRKKVHIKYPFENLSFYLQENGYDHLQGLLKKGVDKYYNFIDHIKVKCRDDICSFKELERIEGHIRYSSSMWYVSKSLQKMTYIICIAIVLFCALFNRRVNFQTIAYAISGNIFFYGFIMLIFIGCFFLAFRFSHYIENYLHNQRLKEVILALEIYKEKYPKTTI